MRPVSSWGRLSAELHEVVVLQDPKRAATQIACGLAGIAYGNGRSYGDVCLNPNGILWQTRGLDHFIAFDPETGEV